MYYYSSNLYNDALQMISKHIVYKYFYGYRQWVMLILFSDNSVNVDNLSSPYFSYNKISCIKDKYVTSKIT